MRWPLVLFALLVVVLHALKAFSAGRNDPNRWSQAAEGARHVFILFSVVAVLMISFGKPGLLPQYSAWALLVVQVIHSAACVRSMAQVERCTVWLSLALLAYLWLNQLPVFDAIPS